MERLSKNRFIDFIDRYYYWFLAAVLLTALFNIFYNLGHVPINSWDEARHGASAFEMLRTQNPIVNTYAYENDYWNLKPPLSFWFIGLGYKIAGFNPFGLRLFSAAAAFITIAVTVSFTRFHFGKLASIISGSVLVTTTQYMLSHSARSGDADSLHVLFFTLAVASASFSARNIKWLYVSGISFSLAFLNKSWHALSIPVIIGLYLLISKTIMKIHKKEWLIFAASSFLPVFIWAIFRYANDRTVFLKKMVVFDLLSRSSSTLEGHSGTSSYYLSTLQYGYWHWMLILAGSFVLYLAVARYNTDRSSKNIMVLMVLWTFVPLLLYSYAKTKITWYILPVFPALAVCIGALTCKIIKATGKKPLLHVAIILILMFSFYKNESVILSDIISVEQDKIQSDLKKTSILKNHRGAKIYTLCGHPEFPACWRQSDLLAAELYGDLKPKDGGLDRFLNEKSASLIMVPKNEMYDHIINHTGLKVLAEGSVSYILSR